MSGWMSLCAIALTLLILFGVRRFLLVRLLWPKNQSYYGMTSRAVRLFKLNGWEIELADNTFYGFFASKSGITLKIKCYYTGYFVGSVTIRDYRERRSNEKHVAVLLITDDPIPKAKAIEGFDEGIYILHYTLLNHVLLAEPISIATLRKSISDANGISHLVKELT